MKKLFASIVAVSFVLSSVSYGMENYAVKYGELCPETIEPYDGSPKNTDYVLVQQITDGEVNIPFNDGIDCLKINLATSDKIEKIYIENGYKKIYGSFYGADVYIPASVEEIYADDADNFFVAEENQALCDIDGVLYSKDKTELKIYGRARDEESYTVPDGVVRVGSILNHTLKKLCFPEGVTEIDSLYGDELDEIVFPSSLKKININGLKSTPWYKTGKMHVIGDGILIGPSDGSNRLVTPPNTKSIAEAAFQYCWFETVHIGASVKEIGDSAFRNCIISKELIIENGVEKIGKSCFENLNSDISVDENIWLKKVYLPASLKSIEPFTFHSAKIEELYLPWEAELSTSSLVSFPGKLFVKKESPVCEFMRSVGFLSFDEETKEAIMPSYTGNYRELNNEGAIGAYEILVLPKEELKEYSGIEGEDLIFDGDKKPFVFMSDCYVPLREICNKFNIPIYWNDELGIAQVGERSEIESNRPSEAMFGDENLVRYNGKIIPPSYFKHYGYFSPLHEFAPHSAVNINGTIYVPISCLADTVLPQCTHVDDLFPFIIKQ